jgi:hypothetical protein
MSDIRMARIDVDNGTWRAFRAMCLELDVEVAKKLGELVRSTVHDHNRANRQPPRGSRKIL